MIFFHGTVSFCRAKQTLARNDPPPDVTEGYRHRLTLGKTVDNTHSGSIQHSLVSDTEIDALGRQSSPSCTDKKEASIAPSKDIIPGIGNADNVQVSVVRDGVPFPTEMMIAIGQHLDLKDLPRFFSMNHGLNDIYQRDEIRYAKSLRMIGAAIRLPEIIEALAAITEYTPDKQPYLLRTLAQKIRIQTHGPVYGATTEWANAINAQLNWHDAQPPGPERNLALQQLIIARGFALAERRRSRIGEDLPTLIRNSLSKLSSEHWPPIFDAFFPGKDVEFLLERCLPVGSFNSHIPFISTKFALMIALPFLGHSHPYTDASTLLRERFNVTEARAREELDRLVADKIAAKAMEKHSRHRNAGFMLDAQHWRRDDHHFAALVTDAFLKLCDKNVYRQHSFSSFFDDDFAALPHVQRRMRERTILLESPTVSALGETKDNAEAQLDAFLKIIDEIGKCPGAGHYIAILNDIIAMPLVARASLLHRLVLNARIGDNGRRTVETFIKTAIDCRNALILGGMQNSPFVSRVSAALILVAIEFRAYDTPGADAIVNETSALAFSHAAAEDWGDVLQTLILEFTLSRDYTVEKLDRIDKHAALFACLPSTTARCLHHVAHHIAGIAGRVWRQLPDEADGVHSRFEVFKQRVGIDALSGEVALASIAESLVPAIVPGVRFLEDVATDAAFDDPDAIGALETALFTVKIRPTLRADSNIDVITNQYTKRSLYLRSRIVEAVRNMVILSNLDNAST